MKKYYILALAALAMAFSCAKNAAEQIVPEESVGKTVTVTCEFAQPDTKVAIDDSNGKTTWEVDDEISIHGKYFSKSVVVKLEAANIINDGKTATFTVTLPAKPYGLGEDDAEKEANPNGYYAVYPASAAIADDSSDHGYWYCAFGNTNTPLMASFYDSANATFTFYNLCGIMSFVVSGDYDSYELEGKNSETLGYSHYTVKITTASQNFNYDSHTTGALTAVSGPVVSDGATPNLICFPNGVTFASGSGFDLYLIKDGLRVKKLSYSAASNLSIPRNSYRPIGDISTHLVDASTPKHDHGLEGTLKEDLSATASANCYIINAADGTNADKLFKFKAYKGNSSQNVGAIKSVDVLWETDNTATAVEKGDIVKEVAYDYQSGNTYFEIYLKTPATMKAGNALIAAKDAGDNILWSWHIWVPSVAISATDKTAVIGGSVMNMNLGALEEVPGSGSATIASLGLLYQWGRKDPFVGAAEWKNYPAKAEVAGSAWTLTKSRVTMAEAILHPTVLYIDPAQSDNKGWMETPDATLWNNSGSKTIYDPCPAGYKVPVKTGSIWTKTDTDWTFDATNHVCELSGVRIPLAGYVECWGGSLYGNGTGSEHAYLWSATSHDGDDERGDCVYIRAFRTSDKYYGNSRGKANAGSVRCVAE